MKQDTTRLIRTIQFDANICPIPAYLRFRTVYISLHWADDSNNRTDSTNGQIKTCISFLNLLKPAFDHNSRLHFHLNRGNPSYYKNKTAFEFMIDDLLSIFDRCSSYSFGIFNCTRFHKHPAKIMPRILQITSVKQATTLIFNFAVYNNIKSREFFWKKTNL